MSKTIEKAPTKASGPAILSVVALIGLAVLTVFILIQSQEISALDERLDAAIATDGPTVDVTADPEPETSEVQPAKVAARADKGAKFIAVRLAAVEARMAELEELSAANAKLLGARADKAQIGAPAGAVAAVVEESADQVVALREDVDALLTGEGLESAEAQEKLQKMMDAAQEKRMAGWRAMGRQRTAARVKEIGEALEFDDETSVRIGVLMQASRDQRWDRMRKVRDEEVTYAEAKELADAEREETEAEIEDLLGAEDYTTFKEKWDAQPQHGL